ncbi:MAG: tetratricopeptide repeat protein [Proteiniphilum sp.]|jgi:tetratricopeptide (TPR) repeat protein|nr:tetratricopeptide repeat protein [Proteiniphilum sp.]
MKQGRFLSVCILMLFCLCTTGQTLDEAKILYQEGLYAKALPAFQAEYHINPGNPSVNQWLGVSLFETGRILEAQKYLEFASERKIPEAHICLGELYTLLYRFEDAEKEFEKYQRVKRRDQAALEKLVPKRAYAEKLRKAVSHTEDLQIIDSMVVSKPDFLTAYNLSTSSGSLKPVRAFFSDRAATGETLFMNERKDKIYYSRGNAAAGIDLYTMEKLLDTFGNEKRLPESVNRKGDQAYPFVLNDGITLYFASTDEPSLGGYDLFATRYNFTNDSYLSPNQLNVPFNSPFNDYMLAIDEEKGIGWFASDRFQPDGLVCIYTFIPNPQVQPLEIDDAHHLARRARISSIADTWKPDVDYRSLRSLARQKSVSHQETAGDFTFVINDRITCHTLSDFRSERARALFSQALGYEKQLQRLNGELSQKRDRYAENRTDSSLAASILQLEKESESLSRETETLRIQARNEEIRTRFN